MRRRAQPAPGSARGPRAASTRREHGPPAGAAVDARSIRTEECRAPDTAPPAPPPRALVGQIHACTALVAVAGVTGLLFVIDALRPRFVPAPAVVTFTGVLLAAGAVAGLLVPRAVIQRRMRGAPPRNAATGDDGVTLEFAATLTGVLALALAGGWSLLLWFTARLGAWEQWLAQRFLHPPWLSELLHLAPAALGLLLVAAAGALVLVALHGWQRLIRPRRGRAVSVWVVALTAAALTGYAASGTPRPATLALAALLASYGAALAAVVRRATGDLPRETAQQPGPRLHQFWVELAGTGVAAALAGAALMRSLPGATLDHAQTATGLTILAAAALAGVLSTGLCARRWPSLRGESLGRLLPVVLFAQAGLLWASPGVAPLAAVQMLATLATGLVGARLSVAFGRAPPALAWVGAASASGYGVGLLAGCWLAAG